MGPLSETSGEQDDEGDKFHDCPSVSDNEDLQDEMGSQKEDKT